MRAVAAMMLAGALCPRAADAQAAVRSVWTTPPGVGRIAYSNNAAVPVGVHLALCVEGTQPVDLFTSWQPALKPHVDPGNCWATYIAVPASGAITAVSTVPARPAAGTLTAVATPAAAGP